MWNVQYIRYDLENVDLIVACIARSASVIITCECIPFVAILICSNVHSCDSFVLSIINAYAISLIFWFLSRITNKLKAISYLLVLQVTSCITISEYLY